MKSESIRWTIHGAINKMSFWKNGREKRKKDRVNTSELPPFLAVQAVYNERIKLAKTVTLAVIIAAAGIVAIQEYRFQGALNNALDKEYMIIPGAVDFMKVRPGLIPETATYYFAEYIAGQIGTFSFRNIEGKYQRASEFMSPQLRETFLAEMRKRLPLYRDLAVVEVFNVHPVKKYSQKTDEAGNPYYLVDVIGVLDKYSNDQKIDTRKEVISLKFRTTEIKHDKPWFYEVTSIKRMELKSYEREQSAKKKLAKNSSDSEEL